MPMQNLLETVLHFVVKIWNEMGSVHCAALLVLSILLYLVNVSMNYFLLKHKAVVWRMLC